MVKDHFDPLWLPGALLAVLSPLRPEWMQAVMAGVIGNSAAYLTSVALLVLAIVGGGRSPAGSVVRALSISGLLACSRSGPS